MQIEGMGVEGKSPHNIRLEEGSSPRPLTEKRSKPGTLSSALRTMGMHKGGEPDIRPMG